MSPDLSSVRECKLHFDFVLFEVSERRPLTSIAQQAWYGSFRADTVRAHLDESSVSIGCFPLEYASGVDGFGPKMIGHIHAHCFATNWYAKAEQASSLRDLN